MNHTPGPWGIQSVTERDGMGGDRELVYITGTIGGHTDRTVASVGHWTDRDNTMEDARLIASAPALLAALKDLVEWVTFRSDWAQIGLAGQEPAGHPIAKARAALQQVEE